MTDDRLVDATANRRVSLVALFFGVAFVVVGVTAIVTDVDEIDADLAWLWVAAFATLGLGGVVSTIGALRRQAADTSEAGS